MLIRICWKLAILKQFVSFPNFNSIFKIFFFQRLAMALVIKSRWSKIANVLTFYIQLEELPSTPVARMSAFHHVHIQMKLFVSWSVPSSDRLIDFELPQGLVDRINLNFTQMTNSIVEAAVLKIAILIPMIITFLLWNGQVPTKRLW